MMKATIHKCEWLDDDQRIAKISREEIELPKKNRLEFLQKIVGGLIDFVYLDDKDLIINDEGLLLNLPLNPFAISLGYHLVGNIVEVHGKLK